MAGRYSREILELPSQPTSAAVVLRSVDDPSITAERLATLIETDMALCARVLRLANSAYYGAPRRVATVGHAVSLLGFDTVRAMAVSAACSLLDEAVDSGPSDFWRHALTTGAACAAIASSLGYSESEAFSAGLLHDIGSVLLHQRDPGLFAATQTAGIRIAEILAAEIDAFGLSHPMAGATALEAWFFPARLVEAVEAHHGADEPRHALGRVVRAGEAVALSLERTAGHPRESSIEGLLHAVRVPPSRLELLQRDVERRINAVTELLGRQ